MAQQFSMSTEGRPAVEGHPAANETSSPQLVDDAFAESAQAGDDRLEQIRALLFGQQMASQAARFEQLEAQVAQSFQALQQELTQKIDQVESRLAKRLAAIEQASDAHAEQSRSLAQTTQSLQQSFEQRLVAIAAQLRAEIAAEQARQSDQDLTNRQQLSDLFQSLSEQLRPPSEQ